MTEKMLCGAAKRNISPDVEDLDNILGSQDVHFERILDELFVRVIAVESEGKRLLFVHFDLDKAPNPDKWMPDLTAETGVPEENVFYITARPHSGPIVSVRPGEAHNNWQNKPPEVQKAVQKYEKKIHTAMLEAAGEALSNMRPARMGAYCGESFINEYNVGMEPVVPLDSALWVVSWVDDSGKPVAFFVNYSMHNALMWMHYRLSKDFTHRDAGQERKFLMSSDVSGFVARLMEDAYPGAVLVWSCGAGGGDLMSRRDYQNVDISDVQVPEYASKEALAQEEMPVQNYRTLAIRQFGDIQNILKRMEYSDCHSLHSAVRTVEVPSFPLEYDADGDVVYQGRKYLNSNDLREGVKSRLPKDVGSGEPYKIRVHLAQLGCLAFMGVSGMLYNSISMELRKAAKLDLIVISDDATLLCDSKYILDDHAMLNNYKGTRPDRRPGYTAPMLAAAMQEILDSFAD